MIYTYVCSNCNIGFEVSRHRTEYQEREKCPNCRRKRDVLRNFQADLPNGFVCLGLNDFKKLGDYAAKKTEKISNDEKDHLWFEQNKYKAPPEKELPRGMERARKKLEIPTEYRFAEKTRRTVRKGDKNAAK
jgi:DNA-directed RNA polymerase subunit RPC12/RpoP